MVQLAETLGAHFDFIRADLFCVRDRVYFGELTNYPEAGYVNWQPRANQYKLGPQWRITPGYWRQDEAIPKLARPAALSTADHP